MALRRPGLTGHRVPHAPSLGPLLGVIRHAFIKIGITFYSKVLFLQGEWLWKDNSIIYIWVGMWVGHGRPNSFCSKSYDPFKLTQLHSPLTGCKFYPTDRRSTYELCWSSIDLGREWLKGVLVDDHRLQTVV